MGHSLGRKKQNVFTHQKIASGLHFFSYTVIIQTMAREREQENEKQPPKRVIFERQDGSVNYLEGAEAEKWSKVMDGLVAMGFVHNQTGQKELGSLQWKQASSLTDVSKTQLSAEEKTAFEKSVENRVDTFRNLWQEGEEKDPKLENYLNLIKMGTFVMAKSTPEPIVLNWLDEQIQIASMGKKIT